MDDQILYETKEFELVSVGSKRLPQITRFVFGAYERMYRKLHDWQGIDMELQIEEDLAEAYRSTVFAAFTKNGEPLAAIRMLKRNRRNLPIENEFGIDVPTHLHNIHYDEGLVVEAGRFARRPARKGSKIRRIASQAAKAVVGAAVMYSTAEPGTALYATLDNQVLELLRHRGFPFVKLAEPKMYLGSPTTPVFVKADDWVALQQAA